MRRSIALLTLLVASILTSCDHGSGGLGLSIGPWVRIVGFIEPALPPSSSLVVPDTVHAGTVFTATVVTYGGTGCLRPIESGVQTVGSQIEITAYDLIWTGSTCPADWHPYPRSVQLRLSAAGAAVIRLHGRQPPDSAVTIERAITVLP